MTLQQVFNAATAKLESKAMFLDGPFGVYNMRWAMGERVNT